MKSSLIILLYIFIQQTIVFSNDINNRIITQSDTFSCAENLGKKINSFFEERNPIISPDGNVLYFVRMGDPGNLGYKKNLDDQDIWYSEMLEDGSWGISLNIGSQLNNQNNNSLLSITPDGNSIILFGGYGKHLGQNGASISHKVLYGWSEPEPLVIKDYYNKTDWYQFYLADNGKVLLMSIDDDKTIGLNDLFVSFLGDDGQWSKPKNLGPIVNSTGNDITPYLSTDGITLFYSSDSLGGYGDYDIFVTRRLDDTWQNWSKPENLGPQINTSGFEAYFKIAPHGDYAYYCSTTNSIGSSDIFRIKIPDQLKPKPIVFVFGSVINSITNKSLEAKIYFERLPDGKEIGSAYSSIIDGKYTIILPAGSEYGFRADADSFLAVNNFIDARDINEYTELNRNLELVPIKVGSKIRLNNIFFDFKHSELKIESFPELNRLIKFLTTNSSIEIEISGHTDSVGTDSYNDKLSKQRAKAVADYLISNKIDSKRLVYIGYGKTKPIDTNDTEEGRQNNRRVEIKILKK